MERSEIRGLKHANSIQAPDSAALHPGYITFYINLAKAQSAQRISNNNTFVSLAPLREIIAALCFIADVFILADAAP